MLIQVPCSKCGHVIKIEVSKVERLEKELAEAYALIARLRGNNEADQVRALGDLFGFTK